MLRWGTKTNIFYLCAGHYTVDYYNNFLPVLLPFIMVKLDMSLTMCGILVMVLAFVASSIQPFVGYITDKHDSSPWLLAAIPLSGIAICLAGLALNKATLFLLCIIMGITVSFVHPVGSALLGKVGNVSNMGRVMSLYVVGGNFGAAVAPATVMFLLDRYGLDILPLVAIPAVVLGILFYFSGLYKLPSANAKKVSSSESISIIKIFANPSVALLNIAMGLRCCTHVSVSTFLPMLMLSHGASNVVSGSMLTVFLMGTAAGGLIGGELGDKFGHKRLMVVSLALTALPTVLFFLYPDAGFISSLLLFMGGFFVQAPQPSSIVWTGRLMPQYIGVASGMMMGLCFGLGSIGAAVTAALGDYIGLETAMFLSVVPVVIATILVIFTPYTKGVVVPKSK